MCIFFSLYLLQNKFPFWIEMVESIASRVFLKHTYTPKAKKVSSLYIQYSELLDKYSNLGLQLYGCCYHMVWGVNIFLNCIISGRKNLGLHPSTPLDNNKYSFLLGSFKNTCQVCGLSSASVLFNITETPELWETTYLG